MRFVRTSDFGAMEEIRKGIPHTGQDYAMEIGTQVEAVASGIIQKIVDFGDVNAGKTIIMKLDNGQQAIYGHLSDFLVQEGQRVAPGQAIALSGNSGASTGPHLHFAIRENGQFVDPSGYEPAIQQFGIGDTGPLWGLVEKGRDLASEAGSDMARWVLLKLGAVAHDIGIWLIKVAPDASITLAMIFALGSIASIPKAGRWTAGATAAAVIAEVIRRATFGA